MHPTRGAGQSWGLRPGTMPESTRPRPQKKKRHRRRGILITRKDVPKSLSERLSARLARGLATGVASVAIRGTSRAHRVATREHEAGAQAWCKIGNTRWSTSKWEATREHKAEAQQEHKRSPTRSERGLVVVMSFCSGAANRRANL